MIASTTRGARVLHQLSPSLGGETVRLLYLALPEPMFADRTALKASPAEARKLILGTPPDREALPTDLAFTIIPGVLPDCDVVDLNGVCYIIID